MFVTARHSVPLRYIIINIMHTNKIKIALYSSSAYKYGTGPQPTFLLFGIISHQKLSVYSDFVDSGGILSIPN
jgi:hypothetical protein